MGIDPKGRSRLGRDFIQNDVPPDQGTDEIAAAAGNTDTVNSKTIPQLFFQRDQQCADALKGISLCDGIVRGYGLPVGIDHYKFDTGRAYIHSQIAILSAFS